MALSLGAGWKSIALAKRSRAPSPWSSAGWDGKHLPGLGGAACVVLLLVMLALMFGTELYFASDSGVAPGRSLVQLGLAGIGVAVLGVAASDPGDTRNWVLAVALFAFVSELLGSLFTIPLFAFLAMHNV